MPERRQRRQADVAGPRDDAEAGQGLAHFSRRAQARAAGLETAQPQDTLQHLLPALGFGREAMDLDLPRFVDAGLGLGDVERELQAAQLVDQAGLLGVVAGQDAAAGRRIEPGAVELAGFADLAMLRRSTLTPSDASRSDATGQMLNTPIEAVMVVGWATMTSPRMAAR